jgi:hypothetical protein
MNQKVYGRTSLDELGRAIIESAACRGTLEVASSRCAGASARHTFANRQRQLWLVMRHMTAAWRITRIQGPSRWRQ